MTGKQKDILKLQGKVKFFDNEDDHFIRDAQIAVLKEVIEKGDYRMGRTGQMAGAHYGELKKKIKELEDIKWAKINKMLDEASNGPISTKSNDDLIKEVLSRKGLSEQEIDKMIDKIKIMGALLKGSEAIDNGDFVSSDEARKISDEKWQK